MESILNAAFDNAVLVSLLAVVVLIVDLVARRPALSHWLWLLLLIKLVTPPLVSVRLALPEISRSVRPAPLPDRSPTGRAEDFQSALSTNTMVDRVAAFEKMARAPDPRPASLTERATSLAQTVAVQSPLGWGDILLSLWLASSGSLLAWTLVRLIRVHRCLTTAPPAPAIIQELAGSVAEKLGLSRCPRVWLVPKVIAPALWAVGGQPRLLIPSELWDRLDDTQRAVLIAHELAHWKRRDHWVRLLELAATTLYWWFPIAWWILRSLHEAEEQCCDAWVVWALPGSERAYGRTLLDTIDFLSEEYPAHPLASTGIGSVATMKMRLSRIMRGMPPRSLSRAGFACVTCLAVFLFPLALRHESAIGFQCGFQIIDLGPFYPAAINNLGQIVGNPMDTQVRRAHRWDRGRWTDIAGLGGTISFASDINDLGQVTGWFCIPREALVKTEPGQDGDSRGWYSPDFPQLHHNLGSHEMGAWGIHQIFYDSRNWNGSHTYPHAFRTGANQSINPETDDLGTLGGAESYGLAINNMGQVVGESTRFQPSTPNVISAYPFRTAPNQPIDPQTDDLHRTGGPTNWSSIDINDKGEVAVQVVVRSRDGKIQQYRGYRTPTGRAIDLEADDLGPSPTEEPFDDLRVIAINDRGEVIGEVKRWRGPSPFERSFRTTPDQPITLPTDELRGLVAPQAINNQGHVLGSAVQWSSHPSNRMALHDGKALYRLSDLIPAESGWKLTFAVDINDRDQIVGLGINPWGGVSGFLLEPAPDISPLIWLLAGTILTGLAQAIGRIPTRGRFNDTTKPKFLPTFH
jgi:beta-lactamase regulating signal transducer with metallopeptidase domain/uncharacterized membrane protein